MQEPIKSSFKTIINDAVDFISANLRQMATLFLPILFFATILGAGLASIQSSPYNGFFVSIIIYLIVYPIYTAALIHLMVAKARHMQPTNQELLLAASRQWVPFFILNTIVVAMIAAGLILIIPAIWLWVRLSFAEFYLVVFGDRPSAAIQNSVTATKPYSMLLLTILLLFYFPVGLFNMIVEIFLFSLTQNPWLSLISSTIIAFIALFIKVVVFRVFMDFIRNEQVPASLPPPQM